LIQEKELVKTPVAGADSATRSGSYTIIVEEQPSSSAPSLTLAKALARLGRATRFATVQELRRGEWLRMLRSAEAIVVVYYHAIETYALGQLATAVALDVPIIRWWVGTDVLNAITDDDVRQSALRLDRIVATNVAVAPHLVEELASVGILAQNVPSLLDPDLAEPEPVLWREEIRPILTYLPGKRKNFFGVDVIERVVTANPDLHFIVVADNTHALASHSNVESLGWVSDMRWVYARAGCLLRITDHDGLPRMLMEALLRGMYAIYSWPLAGCWQARTTEEVQAALMRYREMKSLNTEGQYAMRELLDDRPDRRMSSVIADATVPLATRGHALTLAVRTKLFAEQFR
jgi:hypothetical protein